jgi:pimeloyl-ACP methyl ester carboxylesterase
MQGVLQVTVKFKKVLVTCVLALNCSCSSTTVEFNKDDLVKVQKLLGASLCKGELNIQEGSRIGSFLFVGNQKFGCTVWRNINANVIAVSGWIAINGHELPIVYYVRPPRPGSEMPSSPNVYIYLIGGPGGHIAPVPYDDAFIDILQVGDVLVKFPYSGTAHLSHYPDADLNRAVAQVTSFIEDIKRRSPKTELTLIGESLGGVIVEAALERPAPRQQIKKAILVNPLMFSPDEAIENFALNLGYDLEKSDNYQVRNEGDGGKIEWAGLPSADLFVAFFPVDQRRINLLERLSHTKEVPHLIIFGGSDDIIGKSYLENTDPPIKHNWVSIKNMTHRRQEEFDKEISETISEYIISM